MASKELLDLLNQSIAREMQVAIQYMWQHVLAKGIEGLAVRDLFKEFAITEMKHAEEIAERMAYLGGVPTTKPDPIFVGGKLEEMIKNDVKAEEEAIALYRKVLQVAREEGDEVTHRVFRKILADEEEHHDEFTSLLEKA
jgi:bacterioferritin